MVGLVAVAVVAVVVADNPGYTLRIVGCGSGCSHQVAEHKHHTDCILAAAVDRRRDSDLDHHIVGIVVRTEDIRHIAAVGKSDRV